MWFKNILSLPYYSVPELIRREGYQCEVHEVHTEDGYILEIHRIPAKTQLHTKKLKPILMQHGVGFTSYMFVMHGKNSVAFHLNDLGYDVWLLNHRGNSVSVKHKFLDRHSESKEFHDYSFHEIGIFDGPAVIDYILNKTNNKQLSVIGFSQGATSLLAMCAERPGYNKKISLAVLVAPSLYFRNMTNIPLRALSVVYRQLYGFARLIGIYKVPLLSVLRAGTLTLYKIPIVNRFVVEPVCKLTMQVNHLDKGVLPEICLYGPTDMAGKQLVHYAQLIEAGVFCQYDYGKKENLKRYQSETPPLYEVKNITAPVAVLYGGKDTIVTEKDTNMVLSLLPNVVYKKKMFTFNHCDFFSGKCREEIYKELIQLLDKY